jgi:hypothetical protein
MLKYLIDNIFVIVGGRVFQQTVGIPTPDKNWEVNSGDPEM